MPPSAARGSGPAYWLRLAAFAVVAGAVVWTSLAAWLYVGGIIAPVRYQLCCADPGDAGLAFEDVRLSGGDGVELAGWYVPSSNGAAVIVLHGYGSDRRSMLFHVATLASAGYGVLAYDLRGHAESGGGRSFGWADPADVRAAADWLAARPEVEGRIGILGASIGAQVAVRAAADDPRLAAVVADAPSVTTTADGVPPATVGELFRHAFHHLADVLIALRAGIPPPAPGQSVVGRIAPRPILFISSGDGEAALARRYVEAAGEPKDHWDVPEAGHTGVPLVDPAGYARRIVDLFDRGLLDRAP